MINPRLFWVLGIALMVWTSWTSVAATEEVEGEPLQSEVSGQLWVKPGAMSLRFEQRMRLHDLDARVMQYGEIQILWQGQSVVLCRRTEPQGPGELISLDMEQGAKGVRWTGQDGTRLEYILSRTGWLFVSMSSETESKGMELQVPFMATGGHPGPRCPPNRMDGPILFEYGEDRWWGLRPGSDSRVETTELEPWGWRCVLSSKATPLSFAMQWGPLLLSQATLAVPVSERLNLLESERGQPEKISEGIWRWKVSCATALDLSAELKDQNSSVVSLWKRTATDLDWVRVDRWRGEPQKTSTGLTESGVDWIELEARSADKESGLDLFSSLWIESEPSGEDLPLPQDGESYYHGAMD